MPKADDIEYDTRKRRWLDGTNRTRRMELISDMKWKRYGYRYVHSPRCDKKQSTTNRTRSRTDIRSRRTDIWYFYVHGKNSEPRHRYELSEQTSPKHEKHIESPKFKEGILLSRAIQRRRRRAEKQGTGRGSDIGGVRMNGDNDEASRLEQQGCV
jgi:hypothetical protein